MANEKAVGILHQAIVDNDCSKVREVLGSQPCGPKELCTFELGTNGTALHCAASLGHMDIIKLILKSGIAIDIKRTQGDIGNGGTALIEAVSSLQEDMVDFLIENGAQVNAQDHDGVSPLHMASRENSVEIAQMLVNAHATVNIQDNKGMSPLQISIIRGSDDIALFLLGKGADVHIIDKDGQSPLHYAAEWEASEVVQSLISKGADPNLQDKDGNTPLHVTQDEEIFDFLVKFGADPTLRNKKGKPAKEQRLDMEKAEYRNIDKALGRHGEKMEQRKSHSARVQQQVPSRIFSPGPPIPEAELKTARTNMLRELQKKTGFQGSAISEKAGPLTPRSTALHQVSPLARDDVGGITSQFGKTSISASK